MNPALDTTVTITLPDNSVKRFVTPPSLLEVASSIGPGLARATVAGKVNGELMDACDIIT